VNLGCPIAQLLLNSMAKTKNGHFQIVDSPFLVDEVVGKID
jgi:hypothetical protein